MNFGSLLQIFGPRLLGVAASAIAGLVVAKTKGVVQVDPNTLVEVGTAMIGTYAAAHRMTSSVVNPGDAAKGRLADAEKKAATSGSTVVVAPPSR